VRPGPKWTLWRIEKFIAFAGNRTPAVHPVAGSYTDSPIPVLNNNNNHHHQNCTFNQILERQNQGD
jgi:hypothetical protein